MRKRNIRALCLLSVLPVMLLLAHPPAASAVGAPGAISFQGRLAATSGPPLNGTYSLTFRVYDAADSVTPLCQDTNSVDVADGLFSTYIDNCYNQISGQKLWIGISVGADPEMTPRIVMLAAPYALTLRPGALIEGPVDGVLSIVSTGTPGDYDAFVAIAESGGEAVTATAADGIAVVGYSQGNVALEGYSFNAGTIPAVYGCVAASAPACDTARGGNPSGAMGYSATGDGVQGIAGSASMRGVYATNTASGIAIAGVASSAAGAGHLTPTLYLVQGDAAGDFVVGAGAYLGTRYWRVDRAGKGYFNGGTQASGADFAERVDAVGALPSYGPGDVLVISPDTDRAVELSKAPFATTVAGVYSTNPALLAGAPDGPESLTGLPLAVVGIVPCKASAENGPIRRGDLLVTASTPGHAMRAGDNPPQGSVLGKALQALPVGRGVIEVLVTLQ